MNVLAISCHPDDMEIACAGTLLKCKERGDRVVICHLSSGNLGHVIIPPDELTQMRAREAERSGALAGFANGCFGGGGGMVFLPILSRWGTLPPKKLYATYLSYLPREKAAFPLKMNVDDRGSFTELLRTEKCGQFSVNISKPGITKGQHWHHTKWEFFIVVSGKGLIQQRKIGSDEVLNFEVSGEKIEAVHMLPGYTHNIINLSENENLVTVMWANEIFDSEYPDTYYELV